MEPRKLTRSTSNKVLGGVCGGLAEYLNVDPTIVRLATVVLALITTGFPMSVVYVVMWIVVPEKAPGQIGVDAMFDPYLGNLNQEPPFNA